MNPRDRGKNQNEGAVVDELERLLRGGDEPGAPGDRLQRTDVYTVDAGLDSVLSPRLAARFERALDVEEDTSRGTEKRTSWTGGGAGLFDAALASGKREQILGRVAARMHGGVEAQAAMRALAAAAFTFGREIAGDEVGRDPADVDLIHAETIAPQRWGAARASAGGGPATAISATIAGGFAAYRGAASGRGDTTYEIVASSIASVSEMLDSAVDRLNAIAGIIGVPAALRWQITTDTLGAAAISVIDDRDKLVLQPLVVWFRALHPFPREAARGRDAAHRDADGGAHRRRGPDVG